MGDETKIDPSSPYYLGAGDQPGNLITHVIFKGDNYIAWSRAIMLSLKSRRKFGFVDGTIVMPLDEKKILDWETVYSMIVSWLLRSIDSKISAAIPYFEEAKKLWDFLEKRYCVASGPRLQQLRASITNCRQSKSMSVHEYYTQLMSYYDDLARLKPPHGCECGKCTCSVAAKYQSDKDEEVLHQFLIGIDDDCYSVVRTNLLSQQPPVTMDRAYQAFLQEERSRGISHSKGNTDRDDVHVFAVTSDRFKSSTIRRDKSKLFCSHCQRRGHDNAGCFLLHGYPEWWLDKYGPQASTASKPAAPPKSAVAAAFDRNLLPPKSVVHPSTKSASIRAHAVGGGPVPASSSTASSSTASIDATHPISSINDLQPEHVTMLLNLFNKTQ